MANLKSSKKAARQTKRRTLRNLKVKREMKTLIKKIHKLADEGKKEKAQEKYILVTKKIDKAVKTNLIHKNTAARYKSRLAKRINKAEEAPKKKSTKRSKTKRPRKKASKKRTTRKKK